MINKTNTLSSCFLTLKNKQDTEMKVMNLTSLTGLMLISLQLNAGVVENNQIMPPPGPYQSVMGGAPPAFVPYGSQQAKTNPHQQNQMSQVFSQFPENTQIGPRPPVSPPEWVLNRQQENKDRIEKILKENEKMNRENEKRYKEYLKKAELQAENRDKSYRQWVEKNNRQLKKHWEMMLNQFSEKQKQAIEQAQNLPEWLKQRMLKQHEQQLAMMSMQSPVNNAPGNNGFNQMPPAPPAHGIPSNRGFSAMNQKQMSFNMRGQNSPSMNPGFNRPFFVQPPMPPQGPPQGQPQGTPQRQPGSRMFNPGYAPHPGSGSAPTPARSFNGQRYPDPYNPYFR